MRNISFFLTTRAFLSGEKDITRRLGWRNAQVGDIVMACEKCQGLSPGEKIRKFGPIEWTEVRREALHEITAEDVPREGFPELSREEFIAMFCRHMKCVPETMVTRLVFRRVD